MEVDIEALRDYLIDYCGTAVANGMGPALPDLSDAERAGAEELVAIALQLGIDPAAFEAI